MENARNICSDWTLGPTKPKLYTNQVHIWRIFLPIDEETTADLQRTLSQDELCRLESFFFNIDRERTLVARGGLRNILGRYLKESPNTIQFHYTPLGKPYLKNVTLNFNVSYSKNCIVIAITDSILVGIDVEYYNQAFDYLSIAGQFFTKNEYSNLLAFPPEERCLAFYRYWTLKEAFLKAIGKGLHAPLNHFEVSFFPSEGPKIPISDKLGNSEKNINWQLLEINLGKDYTAALVTSESYNKISLWNWGKLHASPERDI